MKKILIAEDNENSRLLLRTLLEDQGYRVVEAEDGRKALENARKERPDIVISDIMMPVMNGFRLCREIKKDNLLQSIPFIFYTATFIEEEDEKLAMSLGASRFIIKPVDSEEFLKILKEILSEYHRGTLPVPEEPVETNDRLLEMYEESLNRKLEEAYEKLRNEHLELKKYEQRLREAQEVGQMGNWELDLKDNTLWWSEEVYRIFGQAPNKFTVSYKAFLDLVHPGDREFVDRTHLESLEKRTEFNIDYRLLLPGKRIKNVHERCQTQYDENGKPRYSLGIIQDITDRKHVEERLKAALEEKDVLLSEVHHRVKNNMQIISSILGLQSHYVNDESDSELFLECQNRIKSMAFVHEMLYSSADYSKIDFSDYMKALVNEISKSSFPLNHNIKVSIDSARVYLGLNDAVPCGLIMQELLSNSFKHAFPDGRPGEIKINIARDGGNIIFEIVDNGIGLPHGFDINNAKGLGFQIVLSLVNQVKGTLNIDNKKGTGFTVRMKRN